MGIIKRLKWKDKTGKTTDYDLGAKASNVEQDATHRFVSDTEKQTWNGKADPEDIPSGSAADYGVANNDTTNRTDMLVTAQVAYQHGKEIDQLNSEMASMTDSGAITGMDAREDGVYITYVPTAGADAVTKKLGSKNFQLGVSCYSSSDTAGSFSQYLYRGIDVSDYSKLKIITGTGLNVTVDNVLAQKEGDCYLLNGNSLSFAIQTRPAGAKVEFELLA